MPKHCEGKVVYTNNKIEAVCNENIHDHTSVTAAAQFVGRDLPSTPSHNLQDLIYLATEALSDSTELKGAIQINLSVCLSDGHAGSAIKVLVAIHYSVLDARNGYIRTTTTI